jgi:FkbM family methyltransferase
LEKEPETIAWLDNYAKLGGVFYDVGANIGCYSIYAAYLNPSLGVFAFEPVQENYCALVNNIVLNGTTNIYSFPFAVSNANKLTSIFINDSRVGNSGAQIDKPTDERGNHFNQLSTQLVLGLSLDSLVNDFRFPAPNFVKIDVDGHEKNIILGMSSILMMNSLKSILVEFNSIPEEEYFSKFFERFGFEPDHLFNNYPGHSKNRRANNNGTAKNCVFKRV